MAPRLYVIPASHPCACAEAAFRVKGVEHDVTELPNVLHAPVMRARFGRRTVPALRADGENVQGSSAILRWIDERHPDPPFFASPEIEAAEAWGEAELQPIGRRVIWLALRSSPTSMPSYVADSRIPGATLMTRASGRVLAPAGQRLNAAYADAVREDMAALPGHLERIDSWIESGVVGGEQANAADLQIGSTLALLRTVEDVRAIIDEHRAAELTWRFFPQYPGHVPAGVLR